MKTIRNMRFSALSLVITALAVLPGGLYAQEKELPSEAVEVIKNFDARLDDARKISLPPAPLLQDTQGLRLTYDVQPRPASLTYPSPRLRPLAFRTEEKPETYNGFVRAGYGLPSSPWLQAGYVFRKEDVADIHLGVLHHSANYKKLANQRFATTQVDLDGNGTIHEQFALHGNVGFHQDIVSFYGYDHADTAFTASATKQRFNRFSIGGEVSNARKNDVQIDYKARMGFYSLTDFFDSKETGLDIGVTAVKWFADSHPLKIDIGDRLAAFSDTIDKSINTFWIHPSFTYHGETFRVRGGFRLVSHHEDFKVLPDVEALVTLAGNALAVYAGWNGDFYQYSFDHLRTTNPFIASALDPRVSLFTEIYGGVKGAASGWNYQAQAGFKWTDDLAMFLPDPLDTRRFRVLYDTVRILYVSATAGIELWPGFEVSGTLLQNFYDPVQEESAWHLPGLEAFLHAQYHLLDERLLLRADGYLASGVTTLNAEDKSHRLGHLVDLSTSAHFRIIRPLWAWLQVNNLTDNQRERWYRYPSYGINILGGLLFRF